MTNTNNTNTNTNNTNTATNNTTDTNNATQAGPWFHWAGSPSILEKGVPLSVLRFRIRSSPDS